MKLYLARKTKNIFLSWLISYIFILLVPIIIINIAYFSNVKVLEDEIRTAHMASLKQMQQLVDSKLREVQRISTEISLDENHSSLANVDELQPYHRFLMSHIIDQLHTYKVANIVIEDIYIYYKCEDTILSSRGKGNADEYYDLYYKSSKLPYREWIDILRKPHFKDYICLETNKSNQEKLKGIAFIQTVPLYHIKNPSANIVVLINEKMLQQAMEEINWLSEGRIFILDQSSNVMAPTEPLNLENNYKYDEFDDLQGFFQDKIDGNDFIVTYITSELNDWKYISLIPKNIFLEKAKYTRNIMLMSIVVCLILGIIAAYLMAKNNYNPINKIVRIFEEKNNNQISKNKYVGYDYIEQSLLEMKDKESKMNKLINQQNTVLVNNFLRKLIKGQLREMPAIWQGCKSYNIQFGGNTFVVMLFNIDNYGEIWDKDDKYHPLDTLKTMYFIITNVIEELVNVEHNCFMFDIDGMLLCLINLKESVEAPIKDMTELVQKGKDFISQEFDINFIVSISSICNLLTKLPEAYHQALDGIEYKMILDGGDIICYDDIKMKEHNVNQYKYTIDEERQFINCIKARDYKKSKDILDRIFSVFLSTDYIPIQLVKCRMFGLINTMINVLDNIYFEHEKEIVSDLNFVERLLNCKSVKDLHKEMICVLDKLDDDYNSHQVNSEHNLIDTIISIVTQNYNNPNFGVNVVADILSISNSQLSRLFKKQTSIGLLDYIHRVRIEKSKELLREGNSTIKEIAKKTGYSDSISFIRVFKKNEGITPGKYKQLNHK